MRYLLPADIVDTTPPATGLLDQDHDVGVVPVMVHWMVYEASPYIAMPSAGVTEIDSGSENQVYI